MDTKQSHQLRLSDRLRHSLLKTSDTVAIEIEGLDCSNSIANSLYLL